MPDGETIPKKTRRKPAIAEREPAIAERPVVTNETATDAPQTPLSSAGETQTPRKNPGTKSNPPPIMRRDDLVGAIMRVTGGNGIHSSMAPDTVGDNANKATRLRGLFTNRGTTDLGDVAMLLRESESFDVRDGEHLSEMIRQASFGDVPVSMERQERNAEADKEKQHRDRIRAMAKKYKLKTDFVKFSVLEGRVLYVERQRHKQAVNALTERDKKRFEAAVQQLEGLVSEEEVGAILRDVNERPNLDGREKWKEARRLLEQFAQDARHKEIEGAIDRAEQSTTTEEPDWFKEDDDEADTGSGNGGLSAEDHGKDGDRVQGQSEPAAGEERESGVLAGGEESGQGNRETPAGRLELTGQTQQEAAAAEAEAKAQANREAKARQEAEKAKKEAETKAEIKLRSEAAASTFELGGNAMDNLTGQGSILDAPAAPVAAEKQEEPLQSVTIGQFRHTKTGLMQYSVAFKDKVSPEIFAQAKAIASRDKTRWSAFKGGGAIPGFLFASEAKAKKFASEVDKLVNPAAAKAQDATALADNQVRLPGNPYTYTKHADGRWSWAVSPAPVAKPNFLGANAEVIPKAEKALAEKRGESKQDPATAVAEEKASPTEEDIGALFDAAMNDVFGEAPAVPAAPAPKSSTQSRPENPRSPRNISPEELERRDAYKAGRAAFARGTRRDFAHDFTPEILAAWHSGWDAAKYDREAADRAQAQSPAPTTSPPPRAPSAAAAAASAIKNAGMGLADVAKGLSALFKPKPGTLGTGLPFDEDTYAAAKPYFLAGVQHFKQAGADIAEMLKSLIVSLRDQFGMDRETIDNMKPYIVRFMGDVKAGKLNYDESPAGETNAQEQAGAQNISGEGGVPEVGKGGNAQTGGQGNSADNQPSGANPESVEGVSPANAERPGGNGPVSEVRGPDASQDVGSAGGVLGGGDVLAGQPGASAEGVPDDVPARSLGNYHIADPEALIGGSPRVRFARNKAAIEAFQNVSAEGRAPTAEERDTIARFIGWGSFGQDLFNGSWANPAPKPEWKEADAWLREHLGKDDWQSAQASIINAHYTDPPTVQTMWEMVKQMGFTGGRVLEPSMGIGNFFGMMPRDMMERSQLTGIEMESLTGGMAKMLYPDANIQIKPYQDSKTSDGFYDLVIGNWPFAAQAPLDRRYMRMSPTLHDYFFLKALDQVRSGGLVVGITSSGTMDKAGESARYAMARKADLIGAFRLPSGAFEKYAGTSVVTDILVFRKRADDNPNATTENWLKTKETETPQGTPVKVNAYFADNPQFVLGTTNYGHGTTRGVPGMIVDRPADLMDRLKAIPEQLPADAYAPAITGAHLSFISNHTNDRQQSIVIGQDNGLYVVNGEHLRPLHDEHDYRIKDAKKTAAREAQIRALIGLRKAYASLIDSERAGGSAAESNRKTLNALYASFVQAHGAINESDGLNILKKVRDPFYPSLAALEVKGATGYRPAMILSRPTMRAAKALSEPTIEDAFVLARNKSMSLDMEALAKDAKVTVSEATKVLVDAGAIFKTPVGNYEVSDAYLSGNVRRKLHEAEAALNDGDESMAGNIAALKKVIPPDEPYYRIEAKLGAPWVSASQYRDFVSELLGVSGADKDDIKIENRMGRWVVQFENPRFNHRPEATAAWGMQAYPFSKLVRAAMNNTSVTIRVRDADGNVVVSPGLTEEANTKIGNIREHFSSWVWSDIDRRSVLEKEYNEVMRAIAAPRFDGSFLRLEGMALQRGTHEFSLRAHQTDAIWRGLVNQMGIYAHEVGTGKTYTMAGLAVESRRYGLAKKPLIFAHNANSAAVAREFQEMYPAAKVLYIDNLSPGTIGTTMRQIANDDWDAVVVPHSLIERFALTKESLDAIAAEEITLLEEEAVLAAQEDNSNLTVDMMSDEEAMKRVRSPTAKELVKARNAILARIARMAAQSSREDSVSFEELGVDMVIVDEAHEFKKPPLVTRMKMKGLNKGSSGMSISLRFLTDYVKQQNNGKGVHLFTGTPITNTLAEIYNMQRYVADSQMQRDGIKDWDSWFATFADSQSDVELTSTGEYDSVTRLSQFINTADLRNMIGAYTDIVFADDMPEFKPRHTDGGKTMNSEDLTDEDKDFLLNGKTENPVGRPYKKIINDVAEMTDAQRNYLQILQARATAFKNAQPRERKRMSTEGHINAPILIDNQAPAVGLDPRLFDLSAPDHPNLKINRAAKNILTHFSEDKLATQVVFVERGYVDTVERSVRGADGYPMRTPDRKPIKGTAATFNLVDALVEKLVKGGIPSGQIAIIDGRTSGKRRQEVSDAMNAGTIRVVIGMTKTLGVGVNMQKHLRALHHLDAPWMPGDLEQRNGRGQRQGNQWNTLFEYRYITDRVDGRRWQVLAIKERFIKQFLKANTETRIIDGDSVSDEDDTDIMSSLSEAAGDPRIMLRQKLKGEVERLEKRAYMHDAGRADSGRRYQTLKYDVREMERIAKKLDTDIDAAKPLLEKGKFSITIDGKEFSERQPADAAIKSFVDGMNMYHSGHNLGNIGSFKITLDVRAGQLYGTIEGPGGLTYEVRPSVASIESVLRNLHGRANNLAKEIEDKNKSIPRLLDAARAPFQRADVLAQKKKLLQQLEMDLQTNPVPPPPWLRQGAPVETLVYVNGKEYVVEGHQHGKDGFFVIIATPKGSRRLHYGMARDAQGMDLYEAHLFEPPVSKVQTFKKGDEVVDQSGRQWAILASPTVQDGVQIVFAENKATGSKEELLVDVLKPAGALIQPIPIFDGSEDVEPTIAASEHEQEQANQIQEAAMAGALPGERRLALLDYQDTLARNSGALPGESRYNLATDTKSSPSDRAIYSMVAEGKTAAEILSFIGKASRRPFNRYLANALRNLGAASTLTLDSQGGWRFGNTSQAQRYAAAYNPKTDTVALFTARDAERHTLHELTHAATLKAIAAGGPASLQMRALFLHIKRNGSLDGQYGMSNLDEFVAEAFSNPKFQAALKNIPAPKSSTLRNAWEWFVRLVANMLGFKTAPMRTALDEAMTVGAALMRENAALSGEVAGVRGSAGLPDTITINGVERPTTNSNGKQIAQDEAGVRRFWEWFGESKVTDEKGRPLVLFHGATADFGADGAPVAFDFGRTADEDLSSGKGAYLTTSPEAASRYADGISWGNGGESDAPNVMPVYARIEAPFSKTASYRIEDFESVLPESVVEDAKNSANPGENFLEETQQAIDDLQSRLEDLQAGYLNDEIADEYRIDESDYDSEDEYQAAIEEAIEREVGDAERTIERYEGEVERAWADAKAEYSNTRLSGDEIWTAIKEDLPEYADWKNERQLFGGDSASIEMDTEVARILFDAFGFDGVKRTDKFPIKTQHTVYIANNAPTQIKSATGNSSQFDPANPDIRYSAGADWYNGPSGAPVRNAWQRAKAKAAEILSPKNLDKIIYEMQDKYVDLKRLRDHIKAIGGTITDMNDAYLGEELYHQRLAYRTEKFGADELLPLQAEMRAKGISQSELETFLHARHAPEANAEMAKRNPNQGEIDAGRKQAADAVRDLELQLQRAKATGSATHALERALNEARGELVKWNGAQAFRGTEEERTSLSGMSDAASAAILAGLTPKRRAELDALAVRVDAINEGTLQLLDDYGLMPKAALTAWRNTYQHYIPLHRDEAHPDSLSHPIGQGFNVKGDAAKRRTGSNQKVTNILGHIAMQREAALTRGEKNHVMLKLYLMARQNPLPDVWKVGSAPTIDTIDKATGFVKSIPDPLYKTRSNVLVLRVGGKDVAITINEHNPEALRMAHALKNLDVDDLHYLIPVVGKATRWFASMNTQYNPIFGIINLMRDTQEAALNLSTTELAGKQGEILKDQLSILKEVLQNKGRMPKTGKWAAIFAELKEVGGTTGYRDLFLDAESRGKALQDTLKSLDRGKASQAAHAVADWLSDYNEAMENATRLAAYKAGIDSGMSKERAASLAKNLTVNFNRKGRQTRELGALYAFFNAAVQGTTRMAQTLAGPAGRKIMAGGVLLGALNALLGIAMMGGGDGDDDEWEKIPEFVKERSIIIPIGRQDYLSIPMPLGFQFLPNIGRLAVEMAVYKDKTAGKQMASLFTVLADAFNPLGGSSPPMQIIAPTVMDPFVALAQNKDWTGRPIFIENRNSLDPKPGLQRSKDSATPWAKGFAEAINAITGGTEYTPGGWSPTPDQIDYVIGQLTGGVGREAGKVASTLSAPLTGEELPAHKIPLAGRLYGSTSGTSGQSERFYENITRANAAESEIKGRARDGLSVAEYLRDNPGAVELAVRGNAAEKQVSALRKMRRDAVKQGGPEATGRVRDLNERMAAVMRDFNNESGKVGRREEQ